MEKAYFNIRISAGRAIGSSTPATLTPLKLQGSCKSRALDSFTSKLHMPPPRFLPSPVIIGRTLRSSRPRLQAIGIPAPLITYNLFSQRKMHQQAMDQSTLKQYLADDPPTIVPLAIKPHFDALQPKEKKYAHYISRAALAGTRINLRQVSAESEAIYDFIIELHRSENGEWRWKPILPTPPGNQNYTSR